MSSHHDHWMHRTRQSNKFVGLYKGLWERMVIPSTRCLLTAIHCICWHLVDRKPGIAKICSKFQLLSTTSHGIPPQGTAPNTWHIITWYPTIYHMVQCYMVSNHITWYYNTCNRYLLTTILHIEPWMISYHTAYCIPYAIACGMCHVVCRV